MASTSIPRFALSASRRWRSISTVSSVDAHHDVLRFAWNNRLASGSVLRQGIDFCMLAADGRFQSIAGFLEPTGT